MAEVNPFEPHMPDVDVPADIASVFAKARTDVANAGVKERLAPGQHKIGILTPGRLLMIVNAPKPGSVPDQFIAQVKALLPSDKPLNITAIGFNALDALMNDKAKCIPMLGQLLGFAYVGHNVLVFEGHASALEHALKDCDVLWIDSAMLPFLEEGWTDVAYRMMMSPPRILVCDRKSGQLLPVVKSSDAKGWRYSEPDGEASYVNCLLTTLAKNAPAPVQVAVSSPVPDLARLTGDPQQLEWIRGLPFRYDALDAAKVIGIIQRVSKLPVPNGSPSTGTLTAQLATKGGKREKVSFRLMLSADAMGRHLLDILKLPPAA
jgi:hypothetical protein